MDEFFNFEDAAHPLPHSDYDLNNLMREGPYDSNLAFSAPQDDEDAFTCLQHFGDTTPEQQLSLDLHHAMDTTMMGPDDFTDFPRWVDGMSLPMRPCEYCERMRIHCKVLKEGKRKGDCTSCVALARDCSLTSSSRTMDSAVFENSQRYKGICIPSSAAMDDSQEVNYAWNMETANVDMVPNGVQSRSSMEDLSQVPHNMSAPDLTSLNSSNENLNTEASGPKVGARFSRESVRILRDWLSTHHRHPYPSDEEKEILQQRTRLNKTQITNWLANARRRGKVRAPRSTSPSPQQYLNGMDIPRRGTPGLQEMNPMERWKHSPPEHEPASVTAIAKAVSSSTFSSGRESPYTRYGQSDDGSARSICNVSSTSSLGTSHSSNNSFASAFSHKSRGSFGSFNSFGNRGRRRRRRQAPKPVKPTTLGVPPRTFQCTFCTETFKTKHDWQRHEKSLHLSLERWVCSPNGPVQFNAELNAPACVYCGVPNPLEGHCEQHNHSSCAERSLEERTFYRKDHLRQHLNLVHDAKFSAWSMDSWKVATPEIRSRCGFCGLIMDSWSIRVDHLAEHFKGGKSMADWKGDWGFEPQVLDIVENGMPPYLIHDERNTPRPFEASSRNSPEMGKTLEDQIKTGLVDYINEKVLIGAVPTDEDLLDEARKVIRKADAVNDFNPPEVSWFRDLIMLSGSTPQDDHIDLTTEGQLSKRLSWAKRLELVQKQNQTNMNDLSQVSCAQERALQTYVRTRQALGLTPVDAELQVQACRILDEIEVTSNYKCKGAVQWFKYLITSSSTWLSEFRRRAVLPRSSEMANEHVRSLDNKTIDYSIHNYHRLERELIEFVNEQRAVGRIPTDADLQARARMIIFESDDAWNQTAADDPAYLRVFKRQNGLATIEEEETELPTPTDLGTLGLSLLSSTGSPPQYSAPSPQSLHWDLEHTGIGLPSPVSSSDRQYPPTLGRPGTGAITPIDAPIHTTVQNQPSTNTNPTVPLRYFLNDANCYGRLVRELKRFVTACTSPHNPTSHIPSDAEIQNQARWVIYDDDDPWNQTAADNAEWLIRFKRDVGLIEKGDGPGLPLGEPSWEVKGGGTGFSPPYVAPREGANIPKFKEEVDVTMQDKVFKIHPQTAEKFVRDLGYGARFAPPAQVFCSRDLETALVALVGSEKEKGRVPSDEMLRAKAREILGVEHTAADQSELLEKFKALHSITPTTMDTSGGLGGPLANYSLPNFTDDVSMLAEFDLELGAMDLTTDFGTGVVDPSVAAMIDPLAINGGMRMGEHDADKFQDYADNYHVHSATASPLRRRASERLATSSGRQQPTAKVAPGILSQSNV